VSDYAVRAEGVGKRYRIGAAPRPTRGFFGWLRGRPAPPRPVAPDVAGTDEGWIWALRDVGFELRAGEAVGIVGRNGAGKSTLLKLLSRVSRPTTGRLEVVGRLASLLEVGTGFNPEFTGRENVYLNGAILGMSRQEIDRKFDEIVEFSGVERFLYTPVKHYSSGMYVRLAFSVAAHLDPQVLVLDEVLAVGDAAFQKKCLDKMGVVTREGRTILFVSHNMPSVLTLCSRALLLEGGRLVMDDAPERAVMRYLGGAAATEVGDGAVQPPEHHELEGVVIVQRHPGTALDGVGVAGGDHVDSA
jgi:lipopolysaccharide transport system ATP-binding protein